MFRRRDMAHSARQTICRSEKTTERKASIELSKPQNLHKHHVKMPMSNLSQPPPAVTTVDPLRNTCSLLHANLAGQQAKGLR